MQVRGAALLGMALLLSSPARGGVEIFRSTPSRPTGAPPSAAAVRASPATRLPVPFEPNEGQADPAVRFLARGRGFLLLLTDDGAVLGLRDGNTIRIRMVGENGDHPIRAGDRLEGVSNYFLGNDPAKWRREVPHFRSVTRTGVRPGTDLRWRGDRGGIEYEVACGPGASARTIPFEVEGARSIEVDAGGALLVRTDSGVLRHSRPVAFQTGPDGTCTVPARFVAPDSRGYLIEAGPCDPALPLVVDPRLEFSSYLGAAQYDRGSAVAVDSSGAALITGATQSTSFPVVSAFQGNSAGNNDAFVTKFDASGASLVYSTYLGGGGDDYPMAIAVDSGGAAFIVGSSQNSAFPTQSAIQSTSNGGVEAFISKLSASGSQLAYSTFLGGYSDDWAITVAVDSTGAAYVGGTTASTSFPGWGSFGGIKGIGYDGFVLKLNPSGSAMVYGTYIGGANAEYVNGIAVDSSGAAYLAGQTNSPNFPVQGAFQTTIGGSYDGFVAKLSASGTSLLYSSFLGGPGFDTLTAIAVDGNGVATVVGAAGASGFPTQNPLYGTYGGGGSDAVVARIAANGASLLYSSYFGGSGADLAFAVALDPAGSIYVAGTAGTGFPQASAIQGSYGGGTSDAFLLKLNASASAIAYSTYLGGTGDDEAHGVAVHGSDAFVGGWTKSTDFPTQGAYQGSSGGGVYDAFLTKVISTPLAPSNLTSSFIAIDAIEIAWLDHSPDETGFEIQRKIGAGAFATFLTVPAGTSTFDNTGLASGTKYTYRVRAVNGDGVSTWSNETTLTTVPAFPGVPLSPSGLGATLVAARQADLAWTDESGDETFFQIQRKAGAGAWQVLATPGPNATTFSDTGVLPDRSYAYRIRAANTIGFSDYSEVATIDVAASLEVALVKGALKDSASPAKDTVSLGGTVTYGVDAQDTAFDPAGQTFTLRLGTLDDPPLLNLIAPADGWVLKKGKYTWKSPRGSATKAQVVVDTVNGTWKVKLSRLTLPLAPANPLRWTLTLGTDTGHLDGDWTLPTKEGLIKFPVPPPKK